MNFKNKVILITGGSSGIGANAAKHFARLKGSVAIVGRNQERLNKIAEEIKSTNEVAPLIIVADITKDAQQIIHETIKHFGKLNILINSAGISVKNNIENITLESFDTIFDTNVRSVIRLTQLAVQHLQKTKGNVVNVSSVAGLRASGNGLAYCMSKAALDQFTKCVALELAPKGIRVNSVNPGIVATPMVKSLGADEETRKRNAIEKGKTYPIGRIGQVQDTSAAITFLASELAAFLTGVLLPVDGGKCIQSTE